MWIGIGIGIYIAGCIIAFVMIGKHNDLTYYNKISGFFIFISWFFIFSIIMGIIVNFISRLKFYPSFKSIKRRKK